MLCVYCLLVGRQMRDIHYYVFFMAVDKHGGGDMLAVGSVHLVNSYRDIESRCMEIMSFCTSKLLNCSISFAKIVQGSLNRAHIQKCGVVKRKRLRMKRIQQQRKPIVVVNHIGILRHIRLNELKECTKTVYVISDWR